MGRQPYMVRLALGRSPYEPPENTNVPQNQASLNRTNSHSADGYVQQYDERGHPIFPESKALTRDLRRAKNDVLSTMGVVVSGEAGRSGILKDKKSVGAITAENDYGLVVVAFDHVLHFFGSWWVGSLSRRIQTFQSYTHGPLIRLFRTECRKVGWPAEFFSGMPLWAARVTLPICQTQMLEPLLGYIQTKLTSSLDNFYARLVQKSLSIVRSSARMFCFVFFEQIHMFCILQTLHLIPQSALLKPSFLLPFTKFSLIQSPPLPSEISLSSLGGFVSNVACTPFAFAFTYVIIRPIVEDRIYRIIRRHLPKQERPDEVSIQVAMDNDLLEWTLPTAGRRTEDEVRRTNLTLFEDVKEEFLEFQKWMLNWIGYNKNEGSDDKRSICFSDIVPDNIQENIPQDTTDQNDTHQTPVASGNDVPDANTQSALVPSQTLTNAQFTQSPDELHALELTETGEMFEPESSMEPWFPFQNYDQDPLSNTLFSRPASPESPLTSPRIRASLTHQNSFTTTMELSLQSSRNPNNQEILEPVPEIENGNITLTNWSAALDGPEIISSEIAPIQMDHNMDNNAILGQTSIIANIEQMNVVNSIENDALWDALNGNAGVSDLAQPTVLPHVVEEPLHNSTHHMNTDQASDDGTEELGRRQSHSSAPWRSSDQNNRPSPHKQRVTVLSAYPADALAHHLASFISGVLFIPFESFFYRSLARSYLSSQLTSLYGGTNLVPLSDIRALNAFAGGGSNRDMAAYMGKLAMMLCIQLGVSGSILSVCSAATIGIGRRLFNWGNL